MAESRVTQSAVVLIGLGAASSRVTQSAVVLITGGPLPLANCNNPPVGYQGTPYTHTFSASGGTPPYTFSVASGLPPGLTCAPTGMVVGTPTAPGLFPFTLSVTDSTPRTATINCSIQIFVAGGVVQTNVGGVPFELSACKKRNDWDWSLFGEEWAMRKIEFPPMCNIPQEYRNLLPWDDTFGAIPPQAKTFRPASSIVTPDPASGDQVVLSLTMPRGYDGLLSGIFQFYDGTGFIQGSGDILWRIQVNQRYVKDLSNNPYALGSPQLPFPLTEGQILLAGQTIRYIVNVPNLSGQIQVGSSRIICGLIGFYWPRG